MGLAILGLLHAVFFFAGDTLLTYSLLGITLLFANQWKDVTLIMAAIVTALATALLILLLSVLIAGTLSNQHNDPNIYQTFNSAATHSIFFDLAQARLALLPTHILIIGSLQWGYALAFFFLGFPLTLVGAWLIAGPGSMGAASLQPKDNAPHLAGHYLTRVVRSGIYHYLGCLSLSD